MEILGKQIGNSFTIFLTYNYINDLKTKSDKEFEEGDFKNLVSIISRI